MDKEFVNPSVKYREKIKKLKQENKNIKRAHARLAKKCKRDIEILRKRLWFIQVKKLGVEEAFYRSIHEPD